MNSDTYQHKQVTGDSHSTGEEIKTGKDNINVSHKRTFLMMAGSLLALLFWIAMAGHSGGAGGGQYVTASADDMTQEGGGALAAEFQGETGKSGVLDEDIFGLGRAQADGYCGPECAELVAKVNVGGTPWCDRSSFKLINGVEYCFAPCNKYSCDHGSLYGLGLTSVVSMFIDTDDGGCDTDYCISGLDHNTDLYHETDYETNVEICPSGDIYPGNGAYLCQKCPKITVPAPRYGGATWCQNGGPYYVGQDGKQYCWSTCAAASGNRSCRKKEGFWRLGACQSHRCSPGQYSNLCQKS